LGPCQARSRRDGDLIVLLLISDSVHNAMISDDKSVTGGPVTLATLVGVNGLVGFASSSLSPRPSRPS
jgi:hypothetical protein